MPLSVTSRWISGECGAKLVVCGLIDVVAVGWVTRHLSEWRALFWPKVVAHCIAAALLCSEGEERTLYSEREALSLSPATPMMTMTNNEYN